MESQEITYLVVCIVCVILSAFYASAEIAFIHLQRIRLKHLQDSGRRGADRVARIVERPERFLSVVLTSVSVTETVAVALGGFFFVSLLGDGVLGTVVGIVVMAMVLLLLVKVIPKTVAAQHPEWFALRYAPAIDATSWVVAPVVNVLSRITDIIARPAGAHTIPGALLSKEELSSCIAASHEAGVVDETSAQMLSRVVRFGDRSVREVMTPRTEVTWIQEGATLADFRSVYAASPHTRYPVYEGNFDKVKGVLSSRDVHLGVARGELTSESVVTGFARPVYYVPGTKMVGELFNEMRDRGFQVAIVVSEYGGTSGIVTIRQLVDEIVGEVKDELVVSESQYEVIGEHVYQIEGSMRVAEVKEKTGLNIPQGAEYDTMAGFVLHLLGHLPEQGEQVVYENFRFVVMEVKGNRIARLLLSQEVEQPREEAAEVPDEMGTVVGQIDEEIEPA